MSTARNEKTQEAAGKAASWPSKKLKDALKAGGWFLKALEGVHNLGTQEGMDAFDAAEKLAVAAVLRVMDEDKTLGLTKNDAYKGHCYLWLVSKVAKGTPSKEQFSEVFAWAQYNHSNTDALTALCDTIDAAKDAAEWQPKENGLFFCCQDRNGKEVKIRVTETKLKLLALTRDHIGEGWGRLVEITDADHRVKTLALPAEMLAGKGDDARRWLMRLGLIPASNNKADELLTKYLRQEVTARARCVPRPGWHPAAGRTAGVYVTPIGEAINVGDVAETIVLQSDQPPSPIYGQAGDLDGWKDAIGKFCVGNSRLVLAVSAALAAPLLTPVGLEGGGIHIVGPSSTGKTTALHVAGSVYGGGGVSGFVRSWKTTGNGLEATAAEANDSLLCLDELAQVDAKDLAEAAYGLSNGQGKVRANRDGSGKRSAQWRLLFLSTGEIGLEAKIAEDPRAGRSKAGQAVRCVEIPADAGAGVGLFENLHGHTDGAAMARALKTATEKNYGTVMPAFMAALVGQFDRAVDLVERKIHQFEEVYTSAKADGQVTRVAGRFGLLAAAGELGVELGVLPWPKGEATRAARTCFAAWLSQRGGSGPQEIQKGIDAVKTFLLRFGAARFQHVEVNLDSPVAPKDLAGFRDGDGDEGQAYHIFPQVWRDEVCAGFDANAIARALAADGKLKLAADGKITRSKRLPRLGFKRVIHILPALLADGGRDDDEDDEEEGPTCDTCDPDDKGLGHTWVTEIEL